MAIVLEKIRMIDSNENMENTNISMKILLAFEFDIGDILDCFQSSERTQRLARKLAFDEPKKQYSSDCSGMDFKCGF